jgi:hypothetical protein
LGERGMEINEELDFLRDLPPELTDSILSYLNHSKWRFKMRRVCKKWLYWCNISDYTLGTILASEINEVADSFSQYTTPIGLNFTKANPNVIRTDQYTPVSILSNLTSLIFAYQQITDGRDPTFISGLTNLEVLDVQLISTATLEPLTKLRQLTAIVFKLNDFYDEEETQKNDRIHLKLPFLEAATINAFNTADLPPLFSNGERLTQLSLNKFHELPKKCKDYLAPLPNLRKLQINAQKKFVAANGNVGYHYEMPVHIDAPLLSLESLTTNAEVTFFDTMQKLTYLELSNDIGNYDNNHTGYYGVSLLTNLQVLKLRGLYNYHQDLDLSRLTQLSTLLLAKTYQNVLKTIYHERLRSLCLQAVSHHEDLRQISKLSNLIDLEVSFEYNIDHEITCDIAPLMTLTGLKNLKIYGNTIRGNDLTKLGNLVDLSVTTSTMDGMEELNSMKFLTALEMYNKGIQTSHLLIHGITALRSLKSVGNRLHYNKENIKNLKFLAISAPLLDWSDLTCLTELETFEYRMEPLDPEVMLYFTALHNLRTVVLLATPWHDNLLELSQLRKLQLKNYFGDTPFDPDMVRKKLPF